MYDVMSYDIKMDQRQSHAQMGHSQVFKLDFALDFENVLESSNG